MNNPNLVTKLELVLNGDGTLDKVTVYQPSGVPAVRRGRHRRRL